jgi:hypothetical protein
MEGTETVELSIGSVTREKEVTLGGGESQTVPFEGIDTTELGVGEYEHTVSMGEKSVSGRLTVHEELADNEFIARSTDGIVWFGEPEKDQALEDALQLPPQEDAPDPVVVIGEVNDDGTWQSSTIDFPPLRGLPGLGDTVPRVETPNEPGFEGEINLTEGEERWTVEGQLRVVIPQEEEDLTLQFPLNATTEQSGDLSGEFDRTGSEASVTIVDNATPVNTSTGDDIIDGLLGLDGPAGESGNNWFRLTLDIEQLPVSGGE